MQEAEKAFSSDYAQGMVENVQKATSEASSISKAFSSASQAIQTVKSGISQVKSVISGVASYVQKIIAGFKKVVGTVGKVFSSLVKLFSKLTGISKIVSKIKSGASGIGSSFKLGIKQVAKYAVALFSLRSVYSVLSQCASTWLSSQNSAAQQASTNIDYMKYSLGSMLAPVIEYIIDLFYQLLKMIQKVVYALTGVNIFANASASAYFSMADSADDATEATKSLAGIHDEINNVSESSSSSSSSDSSSPSYDLSTLEDTSSTLLDAIANGDWYAV